MAEPTGTRPFSAFEWMIAGRYLRPRRRQALVSLISALSFLGIMIGIAALIIVMAVMNGFRSELINKILGFNGHMIVQPVESDFTDYAAIADRVNGVAGVAIAVPMIEGQALASGANQSTGVLVRGLREEDIRRLPAIAGNIELGSLEGFAGSGGIAVGTRLAANLGLALGDRLTIVTPRGTVTPMGVTPRIKAYPIVAIFNVGMSEYDSGIVFMPFAEAQAYFNKPEIASEIEVYIDDPDQVGAMRPVVEAAIGRPHFIVDWRQRHVTFFSALEVERNVMFIILTLIVLVAALNIISGLTMLVKEKGHDIAILRTMGATRGAVMRVFFMTGAVIGTAGTLAGLLLGTVICLNIEEIRQALSSLTQTELFSPELYFLSRLPADMDFTETLAVVLMGLGLSYLATLYPAWRAARLDPVEALRYE